MKTKVISIINYKGGVGKSTVTWNLGAELAKCGKRILLIDFDGQGNLTKFTGIEKKEIVTQNIVDMLYLAVSGKEAEKDPIYPIKQNLSIIPCDIRKENWSIRALSELSRETILKRYIDTVKARYSFDYILIDHAPSVGLDFQNGLVASDYYLIVTEAEVASSDGIYTVKKVIDEIRRCFCNGLSPAGVVINKVEELTNLHKLMTTMIQTSWGEDTYIFRTHIPKSIVIPESELMALPVGEYKRSSKAAIAFEKFTREVIARMEKEEDHGKS